MQTKQKQLEDIDSVKYNNHRDDNQRSSLPHDEDYDPYNNSVVRKILISPGEADHVTSGPFSSPCAYNIFQMACTP